MLILTLTIFLIFIYFQLLYIFIPLIKHKNKNSLKEQLPELGLTILVPAFNEQHIIENCIRGAINVNYKNHEIIIINDGSTDTTLNVVNSSLKLQAIKKKIDSKLSYQPIRGLYQSSIYPNIFVLDKKNGGKADALNAGIDYANYDVVITLDADSILEFNSLHAINSAFQDKKVIAAGGTVHIAQGINGENAPSPNFKVNGLIKFQIIQYLTSFYLHKFVHAKFKAMTVIAGAFGAFRRSALLSLNGFRNTVGEDMDITLRIQRLIYTEEKDKKLVIVPEAICFTECPETFRDLFKQRIRWQKAFLDCMLTYGSGLFSEFSFAMSCFFLIEGFMLGTLVAFNTLLVPLVLSLTQTGYSLSLILFFISFVLGLCQGIIALFVSKRFGHSYSLSDHIRIFLFIPFEIVSYRLLGLLWVILGTLMYCFNRHDWNKVERYGKSYEFNRSPMENKI